MNKKVSSSLSSTRAETSDVVERGNLLLQDMPDVPKILVDRMDQYQNFRLARMLDWHPSGKGMFILTRFGETDQVHYVENPGGTRKQITFFREPVASGKVCPDLKRNGLLLLKDIGGSELFQIYYFDLDTLKYKLLSDGSSLNGGTIWNPAGDRFSFYSTQRNGRDWDIYVSDFDTMQDARPVLKEGGRWHPVEWSPDGQKILLNNYVSVNEGYYHILDLSTEELFQINPSHKEISYGFARWSKDGEGIFLTSDEGSEFHQLIYYEISTEIIRVVTPEIKWNVVEIEPSPKGDKLAFTVNEGGISKLYILDTNSWKYDEVQDVPYGQITNLRFHREREKIAFDINSPSTPGDVFVINLDDYSQTRWTLSETGGLNTDHFIFPDLINYETFDLLNGEKRKIPAFYYKPSSSVGPFPVLIKIHGGPASQYVPKFSSTFQYSLNELNVAVIAPNVRGSKGYGKNYMKLDNLYLREDSVKDIGKLLDWIEEQPELDSSRVALIGVSYGGYMVLSSMTHYNERLTCGIDIVGISNFVTFLENTQSYRRYLRRLEYGDETAREMREFLLEISPTTNAQKITKPMFIIQGLNDSRVPVSESEQMVLTIKENEGNVWYLLAKDEGHIIKKKSNKDFIENAIVFFLQKYLLT